MGGQRTKGSIGPFVVETNSRRSQNSCVSPYEVHCPAKVHEVSPAALRHDQYSTRIRRCGTGITPLYTDLESKPIPLAARLSMIRSLRLQNFKSFANQEVKLAPFTLLIGANASGKSNLFDAVRFLKGLGLDYPVTDVLRGRWEGGREIWQGVRGGAAETVRRPLDTARITSTWSVDEVVLHHSVEFSADQHPHICAESLVADEYGQYIFDTHAATLGTTTGLAEGGAINVGLKGIGGGRNPRARYASSRSLLGQIEQIDRLHELVIPLSRSLAEQMANVQFLDITPSRMRGYVATSTDQLGAEGENVSSIVYQLAQSEQQKTELIDWLVELCAPELRDLDFVLTDLGDVILRFVEGDGTKISARSLSDGTLRFLGEIVALLTAKDGSVIFIEEIENGLHPARVHLLVNLYEAVTRARNVQVVATTHSPPLLNALSDEALGNAVLFARSPETDGTITSRLTDLPDFGRVKERRGIEYLFTTKWLERAL